jgi:hypothetical protein
LIDPLLPSAPFFYTFGPGLFVIRIVADWWRIRLYLPLTNARQALRAPAVTMKPSPPAEALAQLQSQYAKMNYHTLSQELNKITDTTPTSPDTQTVLESAFKSKAQQRIHIHHFIFGIPCMFLSWALFAVGQNWWALIIAGITAALFLSELKELITQQWQP